MKIALCQMDLAWLDVKSNLRKIKNYIEDAEAQNAKLVVFPEMALTGFCMQSDSAALELSSPEIKELASYTQGKKVIAFVGAAIREGNKFTNECLILRNGEIISSYAKMNLFPVTDEHKYYSAGDKMITLDIEGFQVTPLICFDTRFAWPFSKGASFGTDAFIIMASWPDNQSSHWKTLLSARAMDTQAFVMGVNRIGSGDGMNFAGECMVVAPSGKPLFEYSSDERLIVVEVDLSYSQKLKTRFPVFTEQHTQPRQIQTQNITIRHSQN